MPKTKQSDPIVDKILKESFGAEVKDKGKVIYSADPPGVVEVCDRNGEIVYLMEDGSWTYSVTVDGQEYRPPLREKVAFTFPDYDKVVEEFEAIKKEVSGLSGISGVSEDGKETHRNTRLFEELLEYHKESAELPDDDLYLIVTAWDFHTHLIDRQDFSPIICFTGLPEKGKSRMARSMIYVARRGIIKASISDAQLIREAQDHRAAMFLDMKDFTKSVRDAGSEDVILSRFEKGLKVARVLYPDKGAFQDMVYFSVYGATIVGSNENLDQIMETRAINIIMEQATKDFTNSVDQKRGNELRNKLVAWKLSVKDQELPTVPKIARGRFGDIIRPLHQVIRMVAPTYEQFFLDLVTKLEKEKNQDKSDTLEGRILESIFSLEGMLINGSLPIKMIADKINEGRSEGEILTYQKIGRKLKVMGFQKTRIGDNSGILWNTRKNQSLAMEYGVSKKETPRTPVTHESPESPETPEGEVYTNNTNYINSVYTHEKENIQKELNLDVSIFEESAS